MHQSLVIRQAVPLCDAQGLGNGVHLVSTTPLGLPGARQEYITGPRRPVKPASGRNRVLNRRGIGLQMRKIGSCPFSDLDDALEFRSAGPKSENAVEIGIAHRPATRLTQDAPASRPCPGLTGTRTARA
jgi:hypothetical protein